MISTLAKRAALGRAVRCGAGFSSSKSSEKIYELRTYSLLPKKVGEFMKLSNDKFHLRTAHSKVLGYWTSDLGGLNEVVHLWEYDSLSSRAEVRGKLAVDKVWQDDYFQKILPMLQHQTNLTLSSLVPPSDPVESAGAFYELWQLNMKSLPETWTKLVLDAALQLQTDNRKICGIFKSEFGPMSSAVLIWSHNTIDTASQLKHDFFNSIPGRELWKEVESGSSKLMSPTVFSPWK